MKIPQNVVTPYNAQATLHFYDAFWALYLPVTVAGRVSDIWRSYFTQALFPLLDLSIGFLPRPLVVQDRNPHSYTADFEAELPLYLKSHTLGTSMYFYTVCNCTMCNLLLLGKSHFFLKVSVRQ